MKIAAFGLVAILAAGSAGTCLAQDMKATQKFTDTQIGFDASGYSNYTLTITGPNGFHASVTSKSTVPSIDLRRAGAVDDGIYNFQLTASTDQKVPVRTALDNGRPGGPATTALAGVSTSGHVHLKGGAIVKLDPAARESGSQQK
jgi:hypothetical protein